jgi:hypothetical protein
MIMFKEIFGMVDWKDVLNRAIKTAWQTAIGVFVAAVPVIIESSKDTWWGVFVGVVVSGIAAVASAVWNGVIKPVLIAWRDRLSE